MADGRGNGTSAAGMGAGATMEPVAVCGIGCRFPGAAGPAAFWTLLLDGRDAITEVPRERWDVDTIYHPEPGTPGKTNTRHAGLIDGLDRFDAGFFNIPPREAAAMDPQQRQLLEIAWEALEAAGQTRERVAGSRGGVFVGISTFDYCRIAPSGLEFVDAYAGTGNALSIAANRLSYALDLRGPSLAVDTACSSSLVAVHLACRSLAAGECDLALAGGVNALLAPELMVAFSAARMMAPDGRCKTFDAAADGYVRGEGCGVVVLRRLADALRDGDPVIAVIRGAAVNQDGRSNGLTAPNGPAQEEVVRTALAAAGAAPEQLRHVEAHGTGTRLGDPIEALALGAVLGGGEVPDPARAPCLLGSVKTNIGHLEAAAGIAGLIKTALLLHHGTVPPSLHFRHPNPEIPFEDLGLRVVTEPTPWPGGAALAGVSSFGFGGTNAHVVLAAAPTAAAPEVDAEAGPGERLVLLSHHEAAGLRDQAVTWADHFAALGNDPAAFRDAAYTAALRRTHLPHRLTVVAGTAAEAATRLRAFAEGDEPAGVATGRCPPRPAPAPAVLLADGSGLDAEAARMLLHEPAFAAAVDAADAVVSAEGTASVRGWTEADEADDTPVPAALREFVLLLGLGALWRHRGVRPRALAGVGIGEVTAAHLSGTLSLEQAIAAARLRAEGDEAGAAGPPPAPQAQRLAAVQDLAAGGARHLLVVGHDDAMAAALAALPEDTTERLRLFVTPTAEPAGPRALLAALGALHCAGHRLDLTALFSDGGRCVPLPSYRWRGQRHWFAMPAASGTSAGSGAAAAMAASEAPSVPVERVHAALAEALHRGRDAAADLRGAAFVARLGAFCADAVTAALRALGWVPTAGERTTTTDLAARLGVAPARAASFARLLRHLEPTGVLRLKPDGTIAVATALPAPPDLSAAATALQAEWPEHAPEVALLADCARALPDILAGRRNPLEVLFPGGDDSRLAKIYRDAPAMRRANQLTAAAVAVATAALPPGRPLTVVEIGAGTGGTTAHVLDALPAGPTRFVFTDVSPQLVRRAALRFGDRPGFVARLLDIERPPPGQEVPAGTFDAAIAANVLHATRDLRATVRHVRSLLAPGGLLVLAELTAPRPWLDLTFGLTDGWWRFADRDLRSDGPLLPPAAWLDLLRAAGFTDAAVYPCDGNDPAGTDAAQCVLVARGPLQRCAEDGAAASGDALPVMPSAALAATAPAVPQSTTAPPAAAPPAAPPAAGTLADRLRASHPAERPAVLQRHVQETVARILGLGPTAAPPIDVGLHELGMDSITALELREALQRSAGTALPATLALEHPTIAGVATHLAGVLDLDTAAMPAARPAPMSRPTPSPAPAPATDATDAIRMPAAHLDETIAALAALSDADAWHTLGSHGGDRA